MARCSRPGPVTRVFGRRTATDRPPDDPSNPTVNFRGERRKNDTHQSTTDPDARLYKKGVGRPAQLAYLGHVLMENRSGLVVDTRVTPADGYGERDAALVMMADRPGGRVTLGGDKGYDYPEFVADLRQIAGDAACGAEHHESAQCDRCPHHATCRLRDQPTDGGSASRKPSAG